MILFQNNKKYTECKYSLESEFEQEIVNANKKLIEIYEQKTKAKIAEIWGGFKQE